MEPVSIATITAALTVLGTEVSKGAASEAGKEAWRKIRQLIGPKSQEAIEHTQAIVTERLESDPNILRELLTLLTSSQSSSVNQLVGSIDAEKVIVAGSITGDIHM
jgi:hypothetical protein